MKSVRVDHDKINGTSHDQVSSGYQIFGDFDVSGYVEDTLVIDRDFVKVTLLDIGDFNTKNSTAIKTAIWGWERMDMIPVLLALTVNGWHTGVVGDGLANKIPRLIINHEVDRYHHPPVMREELSKSRRFLVKYTHTDLCIISTSLYLGVSLGNTVVQFVRGVFDAFCSFEYQDRLGLGFRQVFQCAGHPYWELAERSCFPLV